MSQRKHSTDDVRMHGFLSRSTVAQALDWLDQQTAPLPAEVVPLADAHRRVLSADVIASRAVPAFDRSSMDGYAVRAEQTIGAGDYHPLPLSVVGESFPGRPSPASVGMNECVRIMTGAPMPQGADAVVPVEYTRDSGTQIEVTATVPVGKHVGRIGEDIAAGAIVLQAGRVLRPQDVGVIASLGLSEVSVIRQPRVRVIITGDELVPPGEPCGPHQIYEANSWLLGGLIPRDGGVSVGIEHVPDDREQLAQLLQAPGHDVVLVSGGSSVGAEDYAPVLLAELGVLAIHGIAMRPSSPTGLGRMGEALICLLPGNPVSCLCAYDFFAGRALRQLGGRSRNWPYRSSREPLARKLVSAAGRVDYCRVRRGAQGIEPLAVSGASILSSTTRADGFVVVPEELEGYAPGTDVLVYWYDECCITITPWS